MRLDRPRRAVRARAAEDAGLPAGGRYCFTEPAGQYEDEIENEKELLELRVCLVRVFEPNTRQHRQQQQQEYKLTS